MDEPNASLRRVLVAAGIVPGGSSGVPASGLAAAWARVVELAAAELGSVSVGPGEWSESDRAAVVDAVDRSARVLEAVKAPVLVAQEQAGLWRRPGIRSFEAFRASKNREDLGTARREAAAARMLTELDGGLDALARGEITPSHAQGLRAVTDKVDPEVRAELLTGEGAELVRDLAKQHEPKVFERKVEELAARRHPAEVQDAHEAIRSRRFLRLLPGPEGMRVEGLLDPVAGHRFQLAIEAASPRPAEDDTRTLGQRNADALDAIAGSILAEGALAPSHHVPTQVTITMTEQTFLAAQAHLATGAHTGQAKRATDERGVGPGRGGAADAGVATFPVIRAQDGPLLPPADLGKLMCGSAVGRMVVNAESAPLNVGRSQRTFKNHQRRAVELRDQHCAWPGCAQIARYSEVHHLDHWVEDHGETDVHRGVLVCSFHHHELHRHDLDLVVKERSAPPDSGDRAPGVQGAGTRGKGSSHRPIPGDPDYQPPDYELVPRSRTAADRRSRLRGRLPRLAEQRAAARRRPPTPLSRPPTAKDRDATVGQAASTRA